jgi:hypothetical protein
VSVLAKFWNALGSQQDYFESPDVPFSDPIFRIRTRPGFIFDDSFWDVWHSFPFHVCHVAYYGPERQEDSTHEKRMADFGIYEMRFKPTTRKEA